MKKILSVILVVAMISALCCTAAFAAGSTEWLIETEKEVNAKVVTSPEKEWVKDKEIAKVIAELDEEGQKAFEEAGFDASKVKATVAMQQDVTVETDKVATMTVVKNVEVKSLKDISVAVFLKTEDGEYKLIGVGEPPLEIELEESGVLVIAIIR